MQCTPKASLVGGLICCLLLAGVLGYKGGKSPAIIILALLSCCSALSNAYTLIQNDKDVVC